MRKSVLLVSSLFLMALIGLSNQASAQGMFVPTAYGAWGNTVYGGMVMSNRSLDDQSGDFNLDGHLAAGIGLGNLVKNFGLQTQVNRYAVVYGDRWSLSTQLSRYLGKGVAGALGADNFVRWGSERVPLSPASYYVSFSQRLKYIKPAGSFASRISYTLGAGVGRFGTIMASERLEEKGLDIVADKRSATLLFGAFTLDIMKWLEANIEWSGRNLHAGIGLNFNTWKLPTRIILAGADLTSFTGNGARFVAGLGVAYQFKDVKYVELDTKKLEEKMDKNHKECMDQGAQLKKDHEQVLANQKAILDRLDNLEKQVQNCQTAVQEAQKADDNNANSANSADAKRGYTPDGKNLYDRGTGEYVVVYSRRNLEEAQALMGKLSKKGETSALTQNSVKSWYHVYTHLYSSQQHKDALKKSKEQRNKGLVGSWVLVK